MRRSHRSVIATASFVAALTTPAVAEAGDKVLIVQTLDNSALAASAGAQSNLELVALGYDVTFIQNFGATIPDTVTDYKQVYVVSTGLFDDASMAKLVPYVQGGGHLFVTGERPSPANDPESLEVQEKVLKPLLENSASLQVGTGVEGGNYPTLGEDLITLVTEKTGFAAHPTALTQFYMGDPGIIGGVDDAHVFAKDQNGNPVGAVWTRADLVQGTGCVMLMEDINWWDEWEEVNQPPPDHASVSAMVAHVADFMTYCGDHDLDGILDGDEIALGTDPNNPDTDGDGLCDGTVDVNDPSIPQTCVAGENAASHQDTDGDGIIDALDPDDDGDGIPTKTELADVAQFGNPDSDGIPAWLDTDSDGDGVSDHDEGRTHFNSAGVPDYLDPNYPNAMSDAGPSADGGTSNPSPDSSGCGCRVANREGGTATWLACALAALGAVRVRRRRRRTHAPNGM